MLNLSLGGGDHADWPCVNCAQSCDGDEAPPGSLQPMPIMAIGSKGSLPRISEPIIVVVSVNFA